jgi:hypothetical protein
MTFSGARMHRFEVWGGRLPSEYARVATVSHRQWGRLYGYYDHEEMDLVQLHREENKQAAHFITWPLFADRKTEDFKEAHHQRIDDLIRDWRRKRYQVGRVIEQGTLQGLPFYCTLTYAAELVLDMYSDHILYLQKIKQWKLRLIEEKDIPEFKGPGYWKPFRRGALDFYYDFDFYADTPTEFDDDFIFFGVDSRTQQYQL